MMKNHMATLFLIPALLATPLAMAEKTPKANVDSFARVNGVAVSKLAYETALRESIARSAQDTPALKEMVANQLIAREILRQAAEKQKLQNDPAVVAARDEAMIRRYLQEAVKLTPVSEAEVHARYDAIVASLGQNEYKIGLIAVAKEQEARDIIAEIKGGGDFAGIARKSSLLSSREQGGELDWISFKTPLQEGKTQGVPLLIAQAAVTLPQGGISLEPVLFDRRYYVVRLEQWRPTQIPSFESAAPGIRKLLEGQAVQKASAELMQDLILKAKIER